MESKFTGGIIGLIFITIICMIISVITAGLGTPWAIVIKQKWLTKHTYIDGQQLKFKGSGAALFIKILVWMIVGIIVFAGAAFGGYMAADLQIEEMMTQEFLTSILQNPMEFAQIYATKFLILLGIVIGAMVLFSLYVTIVFKRWFVEHTHHADNNRGMLVSAPTGLKF